MSYVLLLAVPLSTCAYVQAGQPKVKLPFGDIYGNSLEGSNEFLGIPFAAKPLRFAVAQPWHDDFKGGRLMATRFTAQCPQAVIPGFEVPAKTVFSEDCLHLNVWSPKDASNLPVMFWIHGGGLTVGSAMDSAFNASTLARKEKIVVVSTNYRLNVFGFSPTISPEGKVVANLGFLDQREAMRWTRKHIEAFGGNSRLVTIFGESAGGLSVATHVASMGSAGLFDRAIAQSGDINMRETVSDATAHMGKLCQRVGCSGLHDLKCLRAVEASALLQARIDVYPDYGSGQGATIDGDVINATPLEAAKSGTFNHVPFLFGSNEFEAGLFLYPPFANTTSATNAHVECVLKKGFGAQKAKELLNLYSPSLLTSIDQRPVVGDLVSDVGFHCECRSLARALAKARASPWVYSFRRHFNCGLAPGAYHSEEIAYIFQNFNTSQTCKPSDEDVALAKKMSGLWAQFARAGSFDADIWPRFDLVKESVAKLDISFGQDAGLSTDMRYRQPYCKALQPLDTNALPPILTALTECQGLSLPVPTVPEITPDHWAATIVV